ncbi:MAG: hypothetical protein LUE22_06490 [Oscillospiraceae bacterium]|nr:hypothetical protein [Oscillospiraceae bacterium]
MSLTSDTGLTMPVVPAGMNYGGSNTGWGNGDGAWWIIILFLFVFCGWGNGWNNGGNGGGTATQGYDTRADLQRGFDNQAVIGKLDGLTNGLCQQGYQNQQGFHGVDNAVCQIGYQVQNAANDINTATLQGFNGVNTTMLQGFNATNTSLMQGQNALASQLASCCCDTQRSLDGINYNMATQACGIQNAMNNNTRDIIASQESGTRAILDYLCQDKISTLQTENQALRLAASQTAQNATLISAMSANTAEVLNRAAPTPVPAYQVPAPYPYPFAGNGCCGTCA